MEDPTVRRLTKKVFPHLWVRHKLMSFVPSTGIFPFSEMTVFAQGIGDAVIVYLHLYRPTLSNYLEKHIPLMVKSKMQFWTHVAFLCSQARLTNDNAFDYFLTTCAITAEVALYCYINGYDDVLSLASVFFCAFFENELYASFHRSGGWTGLHQYIEDTSCRELHELVGLYIKELNSPSEHLPILITIANEQLAAARREKFMSLLSFKIGEIELEEKTNTLVSRIFHWHFMENHRISEVKRGILKRTEDVRHTKTRFSIFSHARRRNVSSQTDEIPDADNPTYHDFESLCLHDEAQLPESVSTIPKKPFSNKSIQANDSDRKTVRKESKIQMCTVDVTSETVKFSSSSSLQELRNFYESLSSSSERKMNDSKYFRSNNEKYNKLDSSAIKKKLDTRHNKMNPVETCPRSLVPFSRENGATFRKVKHFTPETANKSTAPFCVDDALSEFTKSFQELGFKCLCVGNSSHLDEESANNFANYAEVIDKCRHYQNKYSSIQFAILIPNSCFTSEASHVSETENCGDIFTESKSNGQLFSNIIRKHFNNCSVSPQKPHSDIEKAKLKATTVDKNQFRSANGLSSLQNCAPENIHKSRFVVTKVKEGDLSSVGETLKISRFSVTKVNEKDGIGIFEENRKNGTKISRFTVMKVDENNSRDGASASGSWKNGTPKTSRFTVTKIDENELKNGARILRRNWMYATPQTSIFTVTRVDGNQDSLLDRNYSSEMLYGQENESVHFEDNGSVKYEKRVSFNEIASIVHYTPDSSDSSPNSITSEESLSQNSPEEAKSARKPKLAAKKKNTSNPPTPKNPLVTERRIFFNRFSAPESRFLNDTERYRASNTANFFANIFRGPSSNSRVGESRTESKAETDKQNSSDSSPNSITSKESLSQNSPEEAKSASKPKLAAKKNTSNPSTPKNPLVTERGRFFNRSSAPESRILSDTANFFANIFRRPSSNSRVGESSTESKEEMDKQKIEELEKTLEASGVEDPVVFKI